MDISSLYRLYIENPSVTTDSRNIPPDSLYFALRGERFDGNAFAAQALANGARAAIVDNKEFAVDDRTILVENTLTTLQKLATHHRRELKLPVIGITGTNGKTTTKELIKNVLSKKYKVWATQGNLNNHIGVPLTLLSMSSQTEIGVVEMGANHPFEIKQLCAIAEPDYGLITNIGKAHLEGFGGFQGVIRTKKELYDFLTERHGVVFYNSDNALLSGLLENTGIQKITYGPRTGSFCRGRITAADPYLEIELQNVASGEDPQGKSIRTNLVGDYNFENILAAACIGIYFKVPENDITKAIQEYIPTNNRSQLIDTGKNKVLLDCYNANPSSTGAAIVNFSNIQEKHKVIILGDMLELGEESENEHLHILETLSSIKDVNVFLVGRYYQSVSASFGFTSFASSDELKDWLRSNPLTSSFILVKGSRGVQLEKVVDML